MLLMTQRPAGQGMERFPLPARWCHGSLSWQGQGTQVVKGRHGVLGGLEVGTETQSDSA